MPDISYEKFSSHSSCYHKRSTCRKLANTITVALEQNNDVILQQFKLKIQKEEYSETILIQDTIYQHYLRQLDWMSIKAEVITR